MGKLPRRPTILSPTGHIRSYNFLRFLALILSGCLLSIIGGYINTICIAHFYRVSVSAFTGATSKIAIELIHGNFIATLHLLLLIFSFISGSFISAALVGGSSFRIDRSYGFVLLLESFALALGYLCEVSGNEVAADYIDVIFLENNGEVCWFINIFRARCLPNVSGVWPSK